MVGRIRSSSSRSWTKSTSACPPGVPEVSGSLDPSPVRPPRGTASGKIPDALFRRECRGSQTGGTFDHPTHPVAGRGNRLSRLARHPRRSPRPRRPRVPHPGPPGPLPAAPPPASLPGRGRRRCRRRRRAGPARGGSRSCRAPGASGRVGTLTGRGKGPDVRPAPRPRLQDHGGAAAAGHPGPRRRDRAEWGRGPGAGAEQKGGEGGPHLLRRRGCFRRRRPGRLGPRRRKEGAVPGPPATGPRDPTRSGLSPEFRGRTRDRAREGPSGTTEAASPPTRPLPLPRCFPRPAGSSTRLGGSRSPAGFAETPAGAPLARTRPRPERRVWTASASASPSRNSPLPRKGTFTSNRVPRTLSARTRETS